MTTPGASRVYRARKDRSPQSQTNTIHVGKGASCEWFPQETIVFRGAHTQLETRVALSEGSLFQGWEIMTLGQPASGSLFDLGSLHQRLYLSLAGVPQFIENFSLDERSRQLYAASVGLRDFSTNGILIVGPVPDTRDTADLIDRLRGIAEDDDRPCLWGISHVGKFLVSRYLGTCPQQARLLFTQQWNHIRPFMLNRSTCLPAIWAT